jgi:hypothetical protein
MEPPFCDNGCGDPATVRLEYVGLCNDCAAQAFREEIASLAGRRCCAVSRDDNDNLTLCLMPLGIEHSHG